MTEEFITRTQIAILAKTHIGKISYIAGEPRFNFPAFIKDDRKVKKLYPKDEVIEWLKNNNISKIKYNFYKTRATSEKKQREKKIKPLEELRGLQISFLTNGVRKSTETLRPRETKIVHLNDEDISTPVDYNKFIGMDRGNWELLL